MSSQIRIANSAQELVEFVDLVKDVSRFELRPVKLSSQQEWLVLHDCLSHKSGGFFSVSGYQDRVNDFEALILYQPQGAYNGMAIYRGGEKEVYLLLQARVEPGNSGLVQYGPTVQSTPANYLRLHGGKKTAYLEFFMQYCPNVRVIGNSTQLDLGKRYFQKTKILSYVEVKEMCPCEENMIWVSLTAVTEAIERNNFFNTDLRSMIGVFDWDSLISAPEIPAPQHWKSIRFQSRSHQGNLVSLNQLTRWKLTDDGINPIDNSNLSTGVKLYEVFCTNREVKRWIQPLYICQGVGLIILFTRFNGEQTEFLITYGQEFGISGQSVVLPSICLYGDENTNISLPPGDMVVDVLQSEEGGRFLTNENRYQVIRLNYEEEFFISENQQWINVIEFKSLLLSSNLVSIQLRA